MSELRHTLDYVYENMDGRECVEDYHDRHGTQTAGILTVYDDERAGLIIDHLYDRIAGKVVVEIGGGIGLLACHLAGVAKRVFCIECDPMWMSCYVTALYEHKPKNLTYIFGAAEEMAGLIRGDVALYCTHSGHQALRAVAEQFAPEVIDVYGELVGETNFVRGEP